MAGLASDSGFEAFEPGGVMHDREFGADPLAAFNAARGEVHTLKTRIDHVVSGMRHPAYPDDGRENLGELIADFESAATRFANEARGHVVAGESNPLIAQLAARAAAVLGGPK